MLKAVFIATALLNANPVVADSRAAAPYQVAEDQSRWPIKPSEAAMIAQRSVPGAVVLNVRALPGGQYVVTLRAGNNVQRVTVNAMTGAVY
jgi:uncharacterized membrane protein YkoI